MDREVVPLRLEVPEAQLRDLRDRLARTRWPDDATVGDWSQGVPLSLVRDLCAAWASEYDWRRCEAQLNALGQARTTIDGVPIHLLHVRSPHDGALPLVLTHGWPGSVVEFLDVIGPLTDPPDPADAFHVVVPSLPGYGFSGHPATPGWGVERVARAWATLMERLGYRRFGAHGSDWGTSVSACLGAAAPDRVVGVHLTPPLAAPDPATFGDLTGFEAAALRDREAGASGGAYAQLHATRPQTVAYGLTDSPAALCAWIVEKLWTWTDHDGDLFAVVSRDAVLDNLMLYWLPRAAASSARLYWESLRDVERWLGVVGADPVHVPVGASVFPRENPRPSRRWAARRFTDIRFWSEPPRGGHFPALEQPERLVADLRGFFRLVRPDGL